ncbi:hypothetical protein [Rhodococcus sp. ANT_H53B]|uniref:hypothetical protein n=1 Tax=Rhodococcus sp. ANT_H53B TaxID=2597357 RepID=UPI0011EC9202|nr:hypothetical protein [Rhodococcus sp. ANT_H53B]KAA0925955.1 hypothetical protein FQ188_10395 [Rhodococcus sp. ANT_H53B]
MDTVSGGSISSFANIGASITRMSAIAVAGTAAVAPLVGIVGSLAIGTLGLAAVASPALAAVALGFDGIKSAASTITPQFNALKAAVSSTFETAMAPAFAKLGVLMDQVTPGMQGVAQAVSGAFSSMVDVITGPGKASLDTLLAGGRTFVETMTPGLAGLTQGLLKFGENAAGAAGKMGAAFGGVLQQLGDALAKIPTSAFDGFAAALTGIGNLLGPIVGLFSELSVVLGPIAGTLFTQLGEAINGMTPALTAIGGTVGNALVTVFEALAPVLPQLATAFSTILVAVTPLVQPIADLAAAFGVSLANAMISIAPTLTTVATTFGTILTAVTPFSGVILTVVGAFVAFNAAMAIGTAAVSAYMIVMNIWRAATVAFTAVQFAFNVMLAANPIGLLVIAVIAVVAALVLAYNKSEAFRNIVQTVATVAVGYFNMIKTAVGFVWDILVQVAGYVGGQLSSAFNTFKSIGTSAINAVKAVVDGVRNAFNAVKGAVEAVIGAISRIRFPSPPAWLSSIFGAPGEGATFLPPAMTRFFPDGYMQMAAAGPDLTAASSISLGRFSMGGGGSGATNITNVNITVEGAIDPVAVGAQIQGLLRQYNVTVGTTSARKF